jgi:hypothetical protein
VNVAGKSDLTRRIRRIELACARALLDELEAALDAKTDDRTPGDFVVQSADQLARLATTMKLSSPPDRKEPRGLRHEDAFESRSPGGLCSPGNVLLPHDE